MKAGGDDASPVYHERQSRQLCALHVLNNLFQEPNSFVQANLDGICHEVQPYNDDNLE